MSGVADSIIYEHGVRRKSTWIDFLANEYDFAAVQAVVDNLARLYTTGMLSQEEAIIIGRTDDIILIV